MSETHSHLPTRYSKIAITLHWMIALAIIAMIALGWNMKDAPDSWRYPLFQLHKSVGLTILYLSLVRLLWRVLNPPPALPGDMKAWEKLLSHGVHWGFYGIMIGLPLTGWLMVSASPSGIQTHIWGLLHWPHLPGFAEMESTARKALHQNFNAVHERLAYGTLALLALHIGGALKHQFIDKGAGVLPRMAPGVLGKANRPERPAKGLGVAFGLPVFIFALWVGFGSYTAPKLGAKTSDSVSASQENPATTMADLPQWQVIDDSRLLQFTAEHTDGLFTGKFDDYSLSIAFDLEKPETINVKAIFKVPSLDMTPDDHLTTMQAPDWFDTANHGQIIYQATTASQQSPNDYTLHGMLKIKGAEIPIDVPFNISVDDMAAHVTAGFKLDRFALGFGVESDPSADWVKQDVAISLMFTAEKISDGGA